MFNSKKFILNQRNFFLGVHSDTRNLVILSNLARSQIIPETKNLGLAFVSIVSSRLIFARMFATCEYLKIATEKENRGYIRIIISNISLI